MNRETYDQLTKGLIDKALNLSKAKSKDYATADILSNFTRISGAVKALSLDLTTPTGYALFMVILKIDRIVNLLKQGGVAQNEPIDDSFIDAINYLLLGYAGYKESEE